MPYKLRKVPKKDLYWVVGEDGKHHSKEGLPLEKAQAQMRALYASMRKEGSGMDWDRYKQWAGRKPMPEAKWIANRKIFDPATATHDNYLKMYLEPFNSAPALMSYKFIPGVDKPAECQPGSVNITNMTPEQIAQLYPGTRVCTINPADGSASYRTTNTVEQLEQFQREADEKAAMRERQKKEAEEKYWANQSAVSRFFNRDVVGALTKVADFGSEIVGLVPGVGNLIKGAYQSFAPPGSAYYKPGQSIGQKLLNVATTAIPGASMARTGLDVVSSLVKNQSGSGKNTSYEVMKAEGAKAIFADMKKEGYVPAKYNRTGLGLLTKMFNTDSMAHLPTEFRRYFIKYQNGESLKGYKYQGRGEGHFHGLRGEGFFGDLYEGIKGRIGKIRRRIIDVVSGVRKDYPPSVRKVIVLIGDIPISRMVVRRDPLPSPLSAALNLVTLGKFSEAQAKAKYDKLFHLCIEFELAGGSRYVLEKNEVIHIGFPAPPTKDTQIVTVDMSNAQSNTLRGILTRGEAVMGGRWFVYNALNNNCQDFIIACLQGNNQLTPALTAFVKQPLEVIVKSLPSYANQLFQGVTDAAAVGNVVIEGRGAGGKSPSKRLKAQLERAGVSPEAYLKKAQEKAKALGLAWSYIGFSTDNTHKLQVPNASGKIVRFGSVGLGDHVLYSLAHDPNANEHRRKYLARASKIRGNWKSDRYSPNSLAIGVLW